MDKIVEQTLLYDFYGELLTEHQKKIYELYYLQDLSLSEISEQEGISRQRVYDILKRASRLLENYENKLLLIDKFIRNKKRINDIYDLANKILEFKLEDKLLKQQIEEIKDISEEILNDL